MKNSLHFIRFVLLTTLIGSATIGYSQTTIYANSSTGNDLTGNGSSASPYRSFTKAYAMSASGGIIDLTGTFTWTDAEETADAVYTGFTISKNITINGKGPGNTFIQAHAVQNSADRRVFTLSNNYTLTLNNITLRHGKGWAGWIVSTYYSYGGGAIGTTNSSYSTTLNMTNVHISNNNGTYAEAGIFTAGAVNINNCTFSGNSGSDYSSTLTMYYCGSIKVRNIVNTTFYNNSGTAGAGSIFVDRYGANFINCSVIGNQSGGINCYALSPNNVEAYIVNCILADNTTYDLRTSSGGANGVKATNSIVETTSAGVAVSYTSCLTGDQAGLNVNTPTTNGGFNEYTPYISTNLGSVAIDAGTTGTIGSVYSGGTKAIPTTDQRGVSRTGNTDMGAFEYAITYVWDGGSSTDWATAGNWTNGVPTSGAQIALSATAANDLILDQDRTVHSLNLNNSIAKLRLGNYSLTVTNIINGSSTAYVKTNGTGTLKRTISNGGSAVFPVGNGSYDPVTITNNTGSSDLFSVKVLDEVYVNGTSGSVVSDNRVTRTWDISKTAANGGSGIDLTFNWNAGEVVGVLSPSLFHYETSLWVKQNGSYSSTATSLNYRGYTGTFSPFAIVDASSTLPVAWKQISGVLRQGIAYINWETGSENNVKEFVVQYSQDARNWKNIGSHSPMKSTMGNKYEYQHNSPGTGNNYYRIQQVDINGNFNYSAIVNVISEKVLTLEIMGNPVTNGKLLVKLPVSGLVKVFTGTGVLMQQVPMNQGIQSINVQGYTKGVYYIQCDKDIQKFLIN